MSDNPKLELLRAICTDIAAPAVDVRDLKRRMSGVEIAVAGIRRDLAGMSEQTAIASLRTGTLEDRIERIERRLELADHHPPA